MHSVTITKTIDKRDAKKIAAKRKLIVKLQAAQQEQKVIADQLGGPITLAKIGAQPQGSLLNRFLKGIDESYKHRVNQEILGKLLAEAQQDLADLQAIQPERRDVVRKTLTIIYRNGIIKPNHTPAARQNYHWEYQNKVQPWDLIGQPGQDEIRPDVSDGKVRLHYDNASDHLISNVIDISSFSLR